jgi:hypothetical protein
VTWLVIVDPAVEVGLRAIISSVLALLLAYRRVANPAPPVLAHPHHYGVSAYIFMELIAWRWLFNFVVAFELSLLCQKPRNP